MYCRLQKSAYIYILYRVCIAAAAGSGVCSRFSGICIGGGSWLTQEASNFRVGFQIPMDLNRVVSQ